MTDTLMPLTLPSGRAVQLTYVDLVDLLIDGHIPDPLTGLVETIIAQNMEAMGMATESEIAKANEQHDQDLHRRMIRHIALVSCVEPRLTDSLPDARRMKENGQAVLHIAQLTNADLLAIYYAAQGAVSQLAALFRDIARQNNAVDVVPDGENDAPSPVTPAADSEAAAMGALHGGPRDHALGNVDDGAAAGGGGHGTAAQAEVDDGATAARPKRRSTRKR